MSLNRFSPWALQFNGSSPVAVPFIDGSLEIGNDPTIDDLVGGGRQTTNLYQVVKKRPFARFDTTELSVLSPLTWTYYGSGQTITGVNIYYRRRVENGQWDSVYRSYESGEGIIIPLSIQGDMGRAAVGSFLVLPIFNSNTAWTIGTNSASRGVVSEAWFPYSLTMGTSLAQLDLRSFSWNLEIDPDDDDQHEPEHYLYETLRQRFRAVCKDAAQVTEARLEDGATEAFTAVWRNRRNTAETISQALGTASFVRASLSGRDTVLEAMTTDNA